MNGIHPPRVDPHQLYTANFQHSAGKLSADVELLQNLSSIRFDVLRILYKGKGILVDAKRRDTHTGAKIPIPHLRCPYAGCQWNGDKYGVKSIETLNYHRDNEHKPNHKRQHVPKNPIVLKVPDRDIHYMYVQCSSCPKFFALNYLRHSTQKECKFVTKRWESLNDTFEYMAKAKMKTANIVPADVFFRDAFGHNALGLLRSQTANSVTLDNNFKKFVRFTQGAQDSVQGMHKYYIIRSDKLRLIYVGSTNQPIMNRLNHETQPTKTSKKFWRWTTVSLLYSLTWKFGNL